MITIEDIERVHRKLADYVDRIDSLADACSCGEYSPEEGENKLASIMQDVADFAQQVERSEA